MAHTYTEVPLVQVDLWTSSAGRHVIAAKACRACFSSGLAIKRAAPRVVAAPCWCGVLASLPIERLYAGGLGERDTETSANFGSTYEGIVDTMYAGIQ